MLRSVQNPNVPYHIPNLADGSYLKLFNGMIKLCQNLSYPLHQHAAYGCGAETIQSRYDANELLTLPFARRILHPVESPYDVSYRKGQDEVSHLNFKYSSVLLQMNRHYDTVIL